MFIDTSHLYHHTRVELAIYRHLVRPGGALVLHDTQLERPEGAPLRPPFPVRVALQQFCIEEGLSWEDHGPWPGLGVVPNVR